MSERIVEVEMRQHTQTTTEWLADATVIPLGVLCVEQADGDGSIVGVKVGTGSGAFADLDYLGSGSGTAGVDGDGWTGGSYDPATGVVTFTSDDGLGFATGDLRGTDGADGADGADGQSAYEAAVELGFTGTKSEWLDSLVGATGAAGADGVDGDGWTGGSYDPATGVVTFTSDDGLGFATGDLRGTDGADGADGSDATVTEAAVDAAMPGDVERSIKLPCNLFLDIVQSTTTETSLLLGGTPYTLPAGSWVNDETIFEWELTGALLNETGSSGVTTLRVKFGAITWFDFDVTVADGAGANYRSFVLLVTGSVTDFFGARLVGMGLLFFDGALAGQQQGSTTIVDPTVDNDIDVTAQHDVSSADRDASLWNGLISVSAP